jgi:hypothetical protein
MRLGRTISRRHPRDAASGVRRSATPLLLASVIILSLILPFDLQAKRQQFAEPKE